MDLSPWQNFGLLGLMCGVVIYALYYMVTVTIPKLLERADAKEREQRQAFLDHQREDRSRHLDAQKEDRAAHLAAIARRDQDYLTALADLKTSAARHDERAAERNAAVVAQLREQADLLREIHAVVVPATPRDDHK